MKAFNRSGLSLPEVLVAAAVLSVLLLPLTTSFLTSLGGAGQDMRQVRAATMAQEILDQVYLIRNNIGQLFPVPSESSVGGPLDTELDLDALVPKVEPELGFSLFTVRGYSTISRLHLTPPRSGYRRFLNILYDEAGRDQGRLRSARVLFRVLVRVIYLTPQAGNTVSRQLKLSALVFSDSHREGVEFE